MITFNITRDYPPCGDGDDAIPPAAFRRCTDTLFNRCRDQPALANTLPTAIRRYYRHIDTFAVTFWRHCLLLLVRISGTCVVE